MDMDMKRTALDKLADEFEADVYSGDNVTDCKMYIAKASSNLSLAFTAIRNEEGFQDDDYQQFRKVFEEIGKLREMINKEIKVVEGNILDASEDIIVHQVNCLGVMGAGLAKQIAERYPIVKEKYLEYCNKYIRESLLGELHLVDTKEGKLVANVFGQMGIKKNSLDKKVYTDFEALKLGLERVRNFAEVQSMSVAIPTHIGCGLAGGDWDEIKPMIENVFKGSGVDVKFYHYVDKGMWS